MKKATKAPAADSATIDQERFAGDMEAMRQHIAATALATTQQNERVAALALQLNYSGSTDIAALENSARDVIRRMGVSVFELGGYLLMLREGCPHGQFLPMLERLGLAPRPTPSCRTRCAACSSR